MFFLCHTELWMFKDLNFNDHVIFRKLRPQQLDREARTLGRSLVKTDNEDGDDYDNEDDYDDDYDFSDMDCSNMTFTPIFRYLIIVYYVFDICS